MTRAPLAVVAALCGCTAIAEPNRTTPLDDLGELQWQHRLLVIRVGGALTQATARRALDAAQAATGERHLVWFITDGAAVQSNLGRAVAPSALAAYPTPGVVLIGKDGGVKRRQQALDLPAVFARIDRMPMRQAEAAAQRGAR